MGAGLFVALSAGVAGRTFIKDAGLGREGEHEVCHPAGVWQKPLTDFSVESSLSESLGIPHTFSQLAPHTHKNERTEDNFVSAPMRHNSRSMEDLSVISNEHLELTLLK